MSLDTIHLELATYYFASKYDVHCLLA